MSVAYLACLFGAFWVAVALYRGRHPWRFLAALVAGAGFAHLGWLVLNVSALAAPQRALLDLAAGYSVLFFPLGALLFSWRDPDAWRALPLALAVARVGCLASGCCGGVAAPWGQHATQLYEIVLLALLFGLLGRAPRESAGGVFLIAFGLVRLAIEPFRIPSETVIPPALLAGCWSTAGLCWTLSRRHGVLLAKHAC